MKKLLNIFFSYIKQKHMLKFETRNKLSIWQKTQIVRHLEFLKKHSPYYKALLKSEPNINFETLFTLPIMNKTTMMEHFDQLNTKKITKNDAFSIALKAEETRDFSSTISNVTIGLSSGTSGNRGLFIVSKEEQSRWAGMILAKLLPNSIFSPEKIAFFLRANSNLYETVSSKRIQFRFFDLLDSIEQHSESLQTFKPTILVAPPSMMRILADKINDGSLSINPKKIISVAEVLEPLDKAYIEKTFNQMVHQVYQCTEGFLASTCEKGTLHLNEDLVFIEKAFLDDDKTRFSPIITDFSRTSQPIVRYQLNDILTIKKEPCSCGSVMTSIEEIEGRCDDIFKLKGENGEMITVFPDFVRRWIISSSDKIREYRVIQHNDEKIEIQIVTKDDEIFIQNQIRETIKKFCQNKKITLPLLEFSSYQTNEKGKKLKRVERRGN